MTAVAPFSQLALVPLVAVVTLMTQHAFRLEFVAVQPPLVTTYTLGVPVFSLKRVLGARIVIEFTCLPVLGRMAGIAFVTELALVSLFIVIFAMTLSTLGRQLLQRPGAWYRLKT